MKAQPIVGKLHGGCEAPSPQGGKGEKKTPPRLWKLLSFLFSFQNGVIKRNQLLGAVNSEGLCAKLEQGCVGTVNYYPNGV